MQILSQIQRNHQFLHQKTNRFSYLFNFIVQYNQINLWLVLVRKINGHVECYINGAMWFLATACFRWWTFNSIAQNHRLCQRQQCSKINDLQVLENNPPALKPHYCYFLQSKNRTYNGYTVDLHRRLRQHNGELAGGAKVTTRRSIKSSWR